MLDVGGVTLLVLLAFAWHRMLRVLLSAVTGGRRGLSRLANPGSSSEHYGAFGARLSIPPLVRIRHSGFCARGLVLPGSGSPQRPRWHELCRDLALATAAALLTVIATATPVLVKWALHWGSHGYAEAYAGYWFDSVDHICRVQGRIRVAAARVVRFVAVVSLLRGRERSLLVILVLGTGIGVLGFRHIQSPSVTHYHLLMPLLGGLAAAGAILVGT